MKTGTPKELREIVRRRLDASELHLLDDNSIVNGYGVMVGQFIGAKLTARGITYEVQLPPTPGRVDLRGEVHA